jgi:hypothetical protein
MELSSTTTTPYAATASTSMDGGGSGANGAKRNSLYPSGSMANLGGLGGSGTGVQVVVNATDEDDEDDDIENELRRMGDDEEEDLNEFEWKTFMIPLSSTIAKEQTEVSCRGDLGRNIYANDQSPNVKSLEFVL